MFAFRLVLCFCLFIAACNNPSSEQSSESDGMLLANLYCQAKILRDARFQLADLIRFTEDSLKMFQDDRRKFYQTRLDSLNPIKEDLHLKTKSISDSIHNTQEMLYHKSYQTKEKKKILDEAFTKATRKLCP